jgi:ribonuclease-3 family protein
MSGLLFGMLARPAKSPHELNPLLLAYIGDAVYEVFVRHHLLVKGIARPHEVQREAVRFVSAPAQAALCRVLEPLLSEEEKEVLKRGRNAKSGTVPKHASVSDYRLSTGLEALVGYLYCAGNEERLHELMREMINQVEKGNKQDE